jgi:hypothetical protein
MYFSIILSTGCQFNLILYLFHENYIQPEATSSSPQQIIITYKNIQKMMATLPTKTNCYKLQTFI